MLKLIKEGKKLTKDEMLSSRGGLFCGQNACLYCAKVDQVTQEVSYTEWKATN